MKFGRALFNSLAAKCVWTLRMIITSASPAPSVSNVIAGFAIAAVTRMKRAYTTKGGEPNPLHSADEGKLSAVAARGGRRAGMPEWADLARRIKATGSIPA